MSIEVELPDGTIVEFPDDTPPDVMKAALQRRFGAQQPQPPAIVPNSSLRMNEQPQEVYSPTDDSTVTQDLLAGVGASMQWVPESAGQLYAMAADKISPREGESRLSESERAVDERRKRDAPLMDTAGGMIGNIGGTAGQIIGPGILAALTRSAPALANSPRILALLRGAQSASLPQTFRGAVAQGATLGGLTAVGDGESRLDNALMGGGFAAGGAALGRLPAAARRIVRNPMTRAGAMDDAVRGIMREADNADSLMIPQPSRIPGVSRTLAEESGDAGVARLERNMRSTQPGFSGIDSANNSARAEAIRKTFEGASRESAAAIRAARDEAADAALDMLPNAGFVKKSGIKDALESAISEHKGNPATQAALKSVLETFPDIKTAKQAYNFRKYIDFLLSKQSDKPALNQAKRELMKVKSAVDDAMSEAYPGWKKYLDNYVAQSRRADQATAGHALLRRASAIPDSTTGDFPLSPDKVSRAVSDPDAFAAQATKFPKATAASTFTPGQAQLLTDLGDDMARVHRARTAGSGGNSHTFERQSLQARLQDKAEGGLVGKVWVAGPVLAEIRKTTSEKVQRAMAEVMANPQRYREVAAMLSKKDRSALNAALVRVGASSGSAVVPASK